MFESLSADTCQPFVWTRDDVQRGPRIGGAPPVDIVPKLFDTGYYFLTLSLGDDVELSIFSRYSGDVFSAEYYHARSDAGKVFENGDIFELIIHGISFRTNDESPYNSELESHGLQYLDRMPDTQKDRYALRPGMTDPLEDGFNAPIVPGETRYNTYIQNGKTQGRILVVEIGEKDALSPAWGSKIGGTPVALDVYKHVRENDIDLRLQGFKFVFQLDQAADEKPIRGEWPLHDCGCVYFYARVQDDFVEWRYHWIE